MRFRHPLVKALGPALLLAACGSRAFTIGGAELAAAEQRSFDVIQARRPDADVLYIAHEWQAGDCRRGWGKTVFCRTRARVSPARPWVGVTARLHKRHNGSWIYEGADWPRNR